MNKLLIGLTIVISGIAIYYFETNRKVAQIQSSQVSNHQSNTEENFKRDSDLLENTDYFIDSKSSKKSNNDAAGFDFTPYVSKEMADEIRPLTSRSLDGLNIKMDKDGHEYVDLKKRWSHATISVVDENGEKHTGEWSPENE